MLLFSQFGFLFFSPSIIVNRTGYIEYNEFVVAAMNEKDLLESQKIQLAFSLFDKDGDGFIDQNDIKQVLNHFKGQNPTSSLSLSKLSGKEAEGKERIDDEVIDKILHELEGHVSLILSFY